MMMMWILVNANECSLSRLCFFFSSKRRHTRCALLTGVQTCALPISITGNARPIEAAERTRRLTRAQALMKANDIGAVVIEPGSSMIYFTGVEWWRSERLTAVVLPVEGKPCIVTPFFEEPSVHETLAVPAEIRVWQDRKSTRRNSSH